MAAVSEYRWAPRIASRFGSIDRPICWFSSKLRLQRDAACRFPLIWLCCLVRPGRDGMGGIVVLSADHQLPGDAGHPRPAPGQALLASAMAASLGDLRFSSSASHGDGWPPVRCQGQALPRRTCWITAVAPTTSTLRKASSPARVIAPSRVLPAVE
jgi:hypothetical protein